MAMDGMTKKPAATIKEVAALAKVSQMTVSPTDQVCR